MKLRDQLKELHPNSFVRIGCSEGTGMIYVGRVREFSGRFTDQRCREQLTENIAKATKDHIREGFKKYLDEYVPVLEREVLDCFPSSRKSSTTSIVMIQGIECDRADYKTEYFVDEISSGNVDGVEELAAAIQKQTAEDLCVAHSALNDTLINLLREKQEIERLRAKMYKSFKRMKNLEILARQHGATAEKLERWLHNNVSSVADPDAIIDGIRRKVYGGR